MTYMTIDEPRRTAPAGFSLFALGFRPFYLLAAAFAAVAVPAWVLMLAGRLPLPLPGYLWHAHEMLMGFATAAVVGFLFTAGRNWTGLMTPSGGKLAALAALWLAGRIAMLAGSGPLVALVDLAFLPVVALALGRVLVKADSTRNYFLIGLLLVMAAANGWFHLALAGVVGGDPLRALLLALGVVVLFMTAIGGRVIPMFTQSALRGVQPRQHARLNQAAIGLTGLALAVWAIAPGAFGAGLALLAALLQAARAWGWRPLATLRTPLLWVLHLGHLWVPLGLLLVALTQLGLVAESAAVHALAIGAIAGVIIGMMTRTARGHTARPLLAGSLEVFAYAAIQGAALIRVLTLLALPALATGGSHLAATLWALAFGAYFVRYLPWLIRPRPDGKPG